MRRQHWLAQVTCEPGGLSELHKKCVWIAQVATLSLRGQRLRRFRLGDFVASGTAASSLRGQRLRRFRLSDFVASGLATSSLLEQRLRRLSTSEARSRSTTVFPQPWLLRARDRFSRSHGWYALRTLARGLHFNRQTKSRHVFFCSFVHRSIYKPEKCSDLARNRHCLNSAGIGPSLNVFLVCRSIDAQTNKKTHG